MKTYTFERNWDDDWTDDRIALCKWGVKKWADVPNAAKKLYITVNNRPSKEAYKYKLRPCKSIFGLMEPDIILQLKKGGWRNSRACSLEIYAQDWPKTGYIKVEYSE